ncbi:MAG: hypothetical protein OIN88_11400 [Candidatus Methanoperedens sp.]|nr:hypothetical protein [Candidatus Methanoperedens sp.]
MSTILILVIAIISIAVVLPGIVWLGFQIEPASFPPHPEKTQDTGSVELPPILPTWFGRPILKVHDSFINGEGVLKIEGILNMSETGEKMDQGQNLALWGEAVFAPSVFIADPRASWEAVDEVTAHLVVPFGEQKDRLLFKFDPKTNLITHISAMRYRGQEEEKTPWLIEFTDWKTFHSVRIPVRFSVAWEDEGSPWSYWTVEGVEYNVDISDKIPDSRGDKK